MKRKIAEGGMGSVFIAEHLVLGTEVALKLVSGPWAAVPSAQMRFLREARMTAKIRSPHVVRVLDCRMTAADEPYLVLELLDGETLDRRVLRRGPLPLSEVVEIVTQTCEALAATHAAGIVHRDLKPENVFLVEGPSTFVKLIDFGVARPARAEECVDVDRVAAGTPQFMSPEQMFEPETTDGRADLFALGAVAYYALTGRSPFESETLHGLYLALDRAAFTPPSEVRTELSARLDAWFARALARRPDDRFSSAREMAGALEDAVRDTRGDRPTLPAPSETETTLQLVAVSGIPKPRRRWPLAIAAATILAGASVFAWHDGPVLRTAVAKESAPAAPPPLVEAARAGAAPSAAAVCTQQLEADEETSATSP